MIKAIIFDIGGVILKMEDLALPVMEVFRPEDKEKFWQDLNQKFSPLCRGEGNLYTFWKELAEFHGKDISDDKLKRLWKDDFKNNLVIDKETHKIITALKNKDYKLAICSNIIQEHAEIIRKNKSFIELFKLFDLVIFSNEVKMAKDDLDIFRLAVKQLGLRPEECLFTDDTKKFVENAQKAGISAVHFTTPEKFREDLKKFKINI